jgi:hypothetical protein
MGILLSKTERAYLLGNRKFTREQEYYIKSRLLKKIKTMCETELLLLEQKGYLAANSKNLAAFCKTSSLTDNVEIINKSSAGSGIFVSPPLSEIPKDGREGNISNPRVLSDMGLAIPRPTRLGDPRPAWVAVFEIILTSLCL